jgi:hypothetical protein
VVAVIAVAGVAIGLISNPAPSVSDANYKPAIMVDGEIYWLSPSGNVDIIPDDCTVIGQISKVSPPTAWPDEDGEAIGFSESLVGTDIYRSKDGSTIYVFNSDAQEYVPLSIIKNGVQDTLINADRKKTEPVTPEWSPDQIVGADMAVLDYASDDTVIFHGYFGLYVYDLNTMQLVRSLDLKPIKCNFTQGDEYCEVSVSMDGNTVQLHPMNSDNMYVYTVSDHSLYETDYSDGQCIWKSVCTYRRSRWRRNRKL